jgi:hypothetical protein
VFHGELAVSSDVAGVGVRWRIGLCAGFKAGRRIVSNLMSHVGLQVG